MQTMYHECGYPLLMDSLSEGNLFLTKFYDPKIKDHAEKVHHCPCCQKSLGEKPIRSVQDWIKEYL